MIPKLDNAFWAIDGGVDSVRIVNYKVLGNINQENYHDYTYIQ